MADFRRNKRSGGRNSGGNNDSWNDSDNSGRRDSRGSRGSRGPGRFGRDSGRSGGRSSDRMEKTTVSCDSCKKMCEVPFKPTSNKPVYCDDCFRRNPSPRSSSNDSGKEFAEINKKLDIIMKMLKK
jgi:CxxC-x17-CxxC domain-containing protein